MATETDELEGTKIRLLLVDDHDLYRIGLATLIEAEAEADVEIVAQASGGRMAVRLARELRPDVVLMALAMPDVDGYTATRAILKDRPSTRLVALTASDDDASVERAVVAGACGLVVKETPVDDVVAAVRAAARGGAWLAPVAAEILLRRIRQADRGTMSPSLVQLQSLSVREREVLDLLTAGLENAEIAATLQLATRTVRNHISSILQKLGVQNRVQAAVYAARAGLG